MQSFILTISCKDKPGIVAKVTKFLFDNGFNILESGQFNDKDTDNFFKRTEFHKQENNLFLNHEELIKLKSDFEKEVARDYLMKWELNQSEVKIPALILISKEVHCLNNIFLKKENMNLDIKGVISNHNTHKELVESNGIKFYFLPVTKDSKKEQEDKLIKVSLCGLSTLLIFQTFINIGVNTSLIPTTGMTLPFLSYGGSSLIGSAILAGIILNYTKNRAYLYE